MNVTAWIIFDDDTWYLFGAKPFPEAMMIYLLTL